MDRVGLSNEILVYIILEYKKKLEKYCFEIEIFETLYPKYSRDFIMDSLHILEKKGFIKIKSNQVILNISRVPVYESPK